jgi:16S rRNA (cytosine967-C5)-methyltransferase
MALMPSPPVATIAPARRCAYTVLRRVFERGAYADQALQAEASGLDARDRALAMRLAYGAVQRKGTLDHLIAQLAERPPGRLDPPVLAALRLGLFELLYLRGAPDYAVVADAVELTKAEGRAGHGLVNAVLRRATREGSDALIGDLRDDTPEQAAVKHSHPEWIARLWWQALGAEQARALMACDNEPGEVALRANTLVTDATALAAQLAVATHRDPSTCTARRSGGLAPSWRSHGRRCSWRARSRPAPGSGSSTCARLPAARPRTWRRSCRAAVRSSLSSATAAERAPWRARRRGSTRATSASRSPTRRAGRPPIAGRTARPSTACSSTRPAPGSARFRRGPICAGA